MKGFQKLLSERPAYIKRNAISPAQPMRGFQKFLSEKPYKRNKTLLG